MKTVISKDEGLFLNIEFPIRRNPMVHLQSEAVRLGQLLRFRSFKRVRRASH